MSDKIKLRAPANSGGATHAGVSYLPDHEGAIYVDHHHIARELAPHGFSLWDDTPPTAAVPNMDRSQLVAEVVRRTVNKLEKLGTEEIRAYLMGEYPDDTKLPPEEDAAGVEGKPRASAEEIEAMNRVQLFAYLKARKVKVVPPIDNEQLRKIAHAEREADDAADKAAAEDAAAAVVAAGNTGIASPVIAEHATAPGIELPPGGGQGSVS
jgi:hypothetical protein